MPLISLWLGVAAQVTRFNTYLELPKSGEIPYQIGSEMALSSTQKLQIFEHLNDSGADCATVTLESQE
jgi:hypothetical protein